MHLIEREAAGDARDIHGGVLTLLDRDFPGGDHDGAAAQRDAAGHDAGIDGGDRHLEAVAVEQDRDLLVESQRIGKAEVGIQLEHVAAGGGGQRRRQAVIGNIPIRALDDHRARAPFTGCGLLHVRLRDGQHNIRALRADRDIRGIQQRIVIHHLRSDSPDHETFICCVCRDRHKAHANGDKQQQGDQLGTSFHVVFSFSVPVSKRFRVRDNAYFRYSDTVSRCSDICKRKLNYFCNIFYRVVTISSLASYLYRKKLPPNAGIPPDMAIILPILLQMRDSSV